jgi:hypothetical protein
MTSLTSLTWETSSSSREESYQYLPKLFSHPNLQVESSGETIDILISVEVKSDAPEPRPIGALTGL